MNEKNKILIGCLALLLVMSIGYALFSDTITINGTATAKGEFELTTTCDMDVSNIGVANYGSVSDEKIECEGNVVSASATFDYPGSEKWFRIMIKNTGTIPVKLKEIVELNNPETYFCRKDNCGGTIENTLIYETEEGKSVLFAELWQGYDNNDYQDGEIWYDANYFEEQLEAVLDPEETAYFYIRMVWYFNSNIQTKEPLSINLDVEINWQQVTVE